MMRSVNQFRPKGDPNAAPYSPQRDLANIYLPMLREVFSGLDEANWSPYFRRLMERDGIQEIQMQHAVTVFVEAHRLFVRDREVTCPADAFERAGIHTLPEGVLYALFSRMGEVLAAGFFVALRDVTMQGQISPEHAGMAEMIAAGRQLSDRLSGTLKEYAVSELETVRASEEEIRRVYLQLQDVHQQKTNEFHAALHHIYHYQQVNWWRRLVYACQYFYRVVRGKSL